jgi:recombination protein RecT
MSKSLQATKEPVKNAESLIDLLKQPSVIERFKGLAQEHLSAERMLFLAIECVRRTPELGNCDHLSVLGALITSHSLGLEPNTPMKHAFLIPYKGWKKDENDKWVQKQAECSFQIGYRGFSQLFHRTGKVQTLCARAIRENDIFTHVEGTVTEVRYSKALKGRGTLQGSFCHINKNNGGQDFVLLELEEILKIRDKSETYRALQKGVDQAGKKNNQKDLNDAINKLAETPWVMWEDDMAAKSALKKLSKTADLDSAVVMAAEIDSLSDIGKADFSQVAEARSRDEIFDSFASQQAKQAISAPGESDQPIPKMDLENVTGNKKAAPEKVAVSNKPKQDGPPAGHPASDRHNYADGF